MGIKMGNAVKNCQKNGFKKNLERIARFLSAKERKCDSLSYHSLLKSDLLTVALF